MNVTYSENQSFPIKSRRSLLSRTLALVLNPLFDVACSTSVHRRLSCENISEVFEDFKGCNKHGINVLLKDAVDDIDLIGWISPFTLLIHGSSEDMNTIEQAWIGRMLKPPQDFVIKDFGEISALNMQQIPQSQFISICQTLHQIITSLNENKFNATFECIMNRLSSSFESVVIPPLSAVRKSLDLLVKKQKLDIVEGCYFVTQASCIQKQNILNHASPVGLAGSSARDKENPVFKAEKPTRTGCGKHEKSQIKRNIKISNVNEDMASKKKVKKTLAEQRNRKAGVKPNKRKTKNKKKRCDRKLGKPPHKRSVRNNFIHVSNGNYSFDEFSSSKSKDTIGYLETEVSPLTSKPKQKRFSFLGKLSRLFNRRASCEEDELTSEECESGSENQLMNEYQRDDEHTKLVPRRDRTRRNRKELKKKKEKYWDKKENVQSERKANPNTKRVDKVSHQLTTPAKRTTCKEGNYETTKKQDVLLHKGEYVVKNFNTTRCSHISLTSSASSCSSYESNYKKDLAHDRRNRTVGGEPQGLQYHHQDIYSSWSDTSSFSNGHSSISEDSSDTCCRELTRTPLHYSPAIKHENVKQRCAKGVLNFCSTQAICGDFELSSPSLINPGAVANVQQMKSSSSTIAEHTTNTRTPMMTLNDPERRQSDDKNNSELQTKNLFQLIGIL